MKAYQIRIELKESNPILWRRVIMPADATFNKLNDIIQNVTNFKSGYPYDSYHLYEFLIPEEDIIITNDKEIYHQYKTFKKMPKKVQKKIKGIPDEENPFIEIKYNNFTTEFKHPKYIKIDKYIMKYGKLDYIYDLGDYWQFKIILEKVTDDYNKGYPILIDGANDAPPEDVGGISGFEYFLKIYNNPDNPEHQSYTVWANSQGFRKFDIDHINVMLKFIKYK